MTIVRPSAGKRRPSGSPSSRRGATSSDVPATHRGTSRSRWATRRPGKRVAARLVRPDGLRAVAEPHRREREPQLRLGQERARPQRLVPLREVLEARVDAAVPERRRRRGLVGLAKPRAHLRVAVRTVFDLVLPRLQRERAGHAERCEDSLAQHVAERAARGALRDQAEQHVAGVAVGPAGPRREPKLRRFFEQAPDLVVADLAFGGPASGAPLLALVHQRLVVGESRRVGEQMADRDGPRVVRDRVARPAACPRTGAGRRERAA